MLKQTKIKVEETSNEIVIWLEPQRAYDLKHNKTKSSRINFRYHIYVNCMENFMLNCHLSPDLFKYARIWDW